MGNQVILGVIADDFTGASDAASFLVKGGMKTLLFNGIPNQEEVLEQCQAIVIALKTRTQETSSAIKDTLDAASWLKSKGVKQLYIKYCSTFDSTKEGNIGPILDALLEKYEIPSTILCPALPVNGRVVKEGNLYVNGVPLHESPMKDHPRTPMWDSDIANLMEPQSKYHCVKLTVADMKKINDEKSGLPSLNDEHWYIIPDYEKDEDAKTIVSLFGDMELLSGGSGILTELAKHWTKQVNPLENVEDKTPGSGLLLAGSCSKATRDQIAYYQQKGGKSMKMDAEKLLSGQQSVDDLWDFIEENKGQEVLIYSSDNPEEVKKIQASGSEKVAELLEGSTAYLAKKAVEHGYTRIIVAGGETSGAVTKSLGFSSYIIGSSVAPGVPIMTPRNHTEIRLVLKSGNFGQEDFFLRALEMTKQG